MALAASAGAQPQASPRPPPARPTDPEQESARLALAADDWARLTAPVMINGKGPFPFVIDTGANQTVISRELAVTLGLPAGPAVVVHTTSGAYAEPTAMLDVLEVGRRKLTHVAAPLFDRAALGAAGMLGLDGLRKQTIVLDMQGRRLTVRPSTFWTSDPDAVVVRGKSRYGGLVLVDAHAGRIPIYVILDTGAQGTIANGALRRLLGVRDPPDAQVRQTVITSVSGQTTMAEVRVLPAVTLGGVELRDLPVAFADLHTFAKFHLTELPAMLLGMDVLQAFTRVSVDLGRKTVSFRLRDAG